MSSLAKVRTVTVAGINPHPAFVEVHIGRGLPSASVVGLGDTAVRESRDRVKAAFESSGLPWPRGRITINLAPADLPKAGTSFDLPIAAGIAVAAGLAPSDRLAEAAVVGELGLDGTVKRCRDFLPVALHCRSERFELVCPVANRWEASLVEGLDVVAVSDLGGLLAFLRGEPIPLCDRDDAVRAPADPDSGEDVSDSEVGEIVGHSGILRAVAAAAAGMLNVFLWGPPGSGKTLIGRSSVSLLPDLGRDAALEVRMLHCLVSDRFEASLPQRPPLRAPHHTASPAALVGGGPGIPRPGEVSLAHHGVLFLDELALFSTVALEALRQPLEDGIVRIARAKTAVEYPARPMVVAATNTCPCGASRQADIGSGRTCRCTDQERARYLKSISGPLVERFDLALEVLPPAPASLLEPGSRTTAGELAPRVAEARLQIAERVGEFTTLSGVPAKSLRAVLSLPPDARGLLERWAVLQRASARRIHKMIRLSWALAALDGVGRPDISHVEEAVSLFVLPRQLASD